MLGRGKLLCIARSCSQVNSRRLLGSSLPQHRETDYNKASDKFDFSTENKEKIKQILAKYPSNYKQSAVIPLLWLAQRQNDNWIPLAAMNKIAEIVGVAPIRVYETCTFYTMFNRDPVGKHFIQLCGTTPCMVRGAKDIMKACQDELGIDSGETTDDQMFSLLEVECLGACVNAPMEDLTYDSMRQIIKDLGDGKKVQPGPQIARNLSEGPMGRTSLFEIPKTQCRDLDQLKKDLEAASKE